jgi:delta24-sterol reductase
MNSNSQVLAVEPGMEMGALTHQLLGLGWTIPVIPEFESLTVGKQQHMTGIYTARGFRCSNHPEMLGICLPIF